MMDSNRSCTDVVDIRQAAAGIKNSTEYQQRVNSLVEVLHSLQEEREKRQISTPDSLIASTNQTLQNLLTENDVETFVYLKASSHVFQECQTVLQEMTTLTERQSVLYSRSSDSRISLTLKDPVLPLTDDENVKFDEQGAEIKEIKEHILKYGLKNVEDVLRRHLDKWKAKQLNIGVTGRAGTGKSSLINALRNIEDSDPNAAEVGETQCTTKCTPFTHPLYDNVLLWDIPGLGSTEFPKETYLKDICVDRYDFFLIVFTDRLYGDDIWLAKEISQRKKHFYFLRNKIETDLNNRKRRNKDTRDEETILQDLKMEISERLQEQFDSEVFHLFLISNHFPGKYEFPLLLHQLLVDVPNEKKLTMVFGIAVMSDEVIEEKAKALELRMWKYAVMSGAVHTVPVPFLSSNFDIAIILKEVLFYREQFAIDDKSLNRLADMAGVPLKVLKAQIEFKTPEDIFTPSGLASFLAGTELNEVFGKAIQHFVPLIGTGIAFTLSFAYTVNALQTVLNLMKADAINVIRYVSNSKNSYV